MIMYFGIKRNNVVKINNQSKKITQTTLSSSNTNLLQSDLYQESEKSLNLLNQNKESINRHGKENSKIYRLLQILKSGNLKEFKHKISLFLQRKKYNSTIGNSKFQNYIKENLVTININSKIAIYTCIVGDYDKIHEPSYVNENIDYYIFTDQDVPENSAWTKIDITSLHEYGKLTPIVLNRMIKISPHHFLPDYDYTVYVDGNIKIIADLMPIVCNMGDAIIGMHTHAIRDCIFLEKNGIMLLKKADLNLMRMQLESYKEDGFPAHFGLFQNSILIRKNCDQCRRLMDMWWREYQKYPTRDQLSLPYVMWKSGIDIASIKILGKNVLKNPRFKNIDHRNIHQSQITR